MAVRYLRVKRPRLECAADTKAAAVTPLHLYNNNTLLHGKTVKGINTALSVNTPTLHAAQTKLIKQLRGGMFLHFNLLLALKTGHMTV